MLTIDEKYLRASGYSEGEFLLEIAILLYQQERLSLRKAASLAGLHWLKFMQELDRRQIKLHYDASLL